jgi:SSS family transporter
MTTLCQLGAPLKILSISIWAALLCSSPLAGAEIMETTAHPPLPSAARGQFVGHSNDALIVAGGEVADGPQLQNSVFILPADDNAPSGLAASWQTATLDMALAWGAAVSIDNSMICIGGQGDDGYTSRVTRLTWIEGALRIESLPDLPAPRAFHGASVIDGIIYVFGGLVDAAASPENSLLALDLNAKLPAWETLESCPAPGRMHPVMSAQAGALFITGGVELLNPESGLRQFRPLRSAWSYRPVPFDGTRQRGWFKITAAPRALATATSFPTGQSHLLVADNAAHLSRRSTGEGEPGSEVSGRLFAYHTITDTWISLGAWTDAAAAPRSTPWLGGVALVGGADTDGRPLSHVRTVTITTQTHALHWLDYLTIAGYLVALIWIGVHFSKQEQGSEDFFLGGRRIPWWAVGISLYATGTSAISFMAIPTKTYVTNQVYGLGSLWSPVFWIPAAFVIIPLIRSLNLTSTYEYLEQRFSVGVRLLGSALCVAFQIGGRMSIVLLLPALAMSAVTGIDVLYSVAIMGLLSTIYTVLGGIHAVIWSDVLQCAVLLGGGLLAFAIMVTGMEGGAAAFVASNLEYGKFNSFEWGWDWTVPVFWIFALSSLTQLATFPNDQVMVQRVLATPSPKAARNSAILLAAIVVPGTILFHLLGSALFAHFRANPQNLSPTMENIQTLPLFIVQSLPIGVTGLVIAGLFAASMSSLDSSMNSVATVIVTDFYRRFKAGVTDQACLVLARWLTAIVGVVGTAVAMVMATFEIKSLYDMWVQLVALLGGGFAGVYALGMLTRRAHATGAFIGAAASIIATVLVKAYSPIHFMLYGVVSVLTCLGVGYLASILLPGRSVDLDGLTVYTRKIDHEEIT